MPECQTQFKRFPTYEHTGYIACPSTYPHECCCQPIGVYSIDPMDCETPGLWDKIPYKAKATVTNPPYEDLSDLYNSLQDALTRLGLIKETCGIKLDPFNPPGVFVDLYTGFVEVYSSSFIEDECYAITQKYEPGYAPPHVKHSLDNMLDICAGGGEGGTSSASHSSPPVVEGKCYKGCHFRYYCPPAGAGIWYLASTTYLCTPTHATGLVILTRNNIEGSAEYWMESADTSPCSVDADCETRTYPEDCNTSVLALYPPLCDTPVVYACYKICWFSYTCPPTGDGLWHLVRTTYVCQPNTHAVGIYNLFRNDVYGSAEFWVACTDPTTCVVDGDCTARTYTDDCSTSMLMGFPPLCADPAPTCADLGADCIDGADLTYSGETLLDCQADCAVKLLQAYADAACGTGKQSCGWLGDCNCIPAGLGFYAGGNKNCCRPAPSVCILPCFANFGNPYYTHGETYTEAHDAALSACTYYGPYNPAAPVNWSCAEDQRFCGHCQIACEETGSPYVWTCQIYSCCDELPPSVCVSPCSLGFGEIFAGIGATCAAARAAALENARNNCNTTVCIEEQGPCPTECYSYNPAQACFPYGETGDVVFSGVQCCCGPPV